MAEDPEDTLWLISDREGLSVNPPGLRLPAVTFPADSRESAILLRRWEDESGLVDCFTHGDESFWWGCQRYWLSVNLAILLEAVRLLKPVFAGMGNRQPRRVVITGYAAQTEAISRAVAILSPGAQIEVKLNSKLRLRDYVRWYGLIGVNRVRAALGRIRLKRAAAEPRPGRIVIFESEMQWERGRDREMWSVARALRARGLEVVTVAVPGDRLGKNLAGLLTRPRDHVLADFVGRSAKPFVPTKTPDWGQKRFEHNGYDFTAFVRGWMESAAPKDSLRDSDAEWSRLISRLAPAMILMAHEHYHRAAIGRAAAAAQVRFCAVQHGLLSEYSPLYVLPKAAVGKVTLPWRTFVYGKRDAEILSHLGIHDPASVVVTGSTEWDTLRERAGPREKGRGRLRILYTSQHGLDDGIIAQLLAGMNLLGDGAELRVRLHPWEVAVWRWTRAFREHPGVKAGLTPSGPLERDMLHCDLHVTFSSTCLTHAMIAGIPSILFGANDYPWREQFVKAGLAVKVDSAGGFADAVNYWSTTEARERFSADRDRFLAASGVGKSLAGEKIAEEVSSALGPLLTPRHAGQM